MQIFRISLAMIATVVVAAPWSWAELPLDSRRLPDGREMMYARARGRVTDIAVPEKPARDYQGGVPIEGAIVWLKRNPRLWAISNCDGIFEIVAENGVLNAPIGRDDDDMVYCFRDGFKLMERKVFNRPGVRQDHGRISDYDLSLRFDLERNADWDRVHGDARSPVKASKLPRGQAVYQTPFPVPVRVRDGREIVEIDLSGIVTDAKTGDLGPKEGHPKIHWASHPVGQKTGNRYGLYDVYGNAWERCWDRLAPYSMILRDTVNPKGPESAESIIRYMRDFRRDVLTQYPNGTVHEVGAEGDAGQRVLKDGGFSPIPGRWNWLSLRSGLEPAVEHLECGFRVAMSGEHKGNNE